MASEHDLDVVGRIEAGTAAGVVAVDDAAVVVERTPGAVHVHPADLPAAVALAGVLIAEVVVARARDAERELTRAVASSPALRDGPPRSVPDAAVWSAGWTRGLPITLVSVDATREIGAAAHATMTATAPGAVRVVVLQARAS